MQEIQSLNIATSSRALAGGFADQSGGAYLISADHLEGALDIVQQDPMYVENECVYKVKEWMS